MPDAPRRFLDQGLRFHDFADRVDVRCPKCRGAATLSRRAKDQRLVCTHCGMARDLPLAFFLNTAQPVRWNGYELWYQTACRGHVLWAMNLQHLVYLDGYVSAELRERVMVRPLQIGRLRPRPMRVSNGYHVTSRLPRWMVLRSSRPHVLRALKRLEKMSLG